MKLNIVFLVTIFAVFSFIQPVFAGDHRIGAGVHYWTSIDDIDVDDVDEDGFSGIISYQWKPALLGFEFDLELADKELTGKSEMEYSPQAYVLVGGFIYAGLGVGVHYYDGDFSDPFYGLKAGVLIELLPHIYFDLNANYRFDNWDYDEVEEDVDTDTVTLGGIVRLEF